MRLRAIAIGLTVASATLGGCGPDEGVEVQGVHGTLDCPSGFASNTVFDQAPGQPGSPSPEAALAILTPDLNRPPGDPEVESDDGGTVIFLFTDAAGHRLGRVVVSRPTATWYVDAAERCADSW